MICHMKLIYIYIYICNDLTNNLQHGTMIWYYPFIWWMLWKAVRFHNSTPSLFNTSKTSFLLHLRTKSLSVHRLIRNNPLYFPTSHPYTIPPPRSPIQNTDTKCDYTSTISDILICSSINPVVIITVVLIASIYSLKEFLDDVES